MTSLRYLAIFLLPVIIAVLLFYGTFSLREAEVQESRELFERLSAASAEERSAILLSMTRDNQVGLKDWLYWLFSGSIVLTGAVCGFFVPINSTDRRTVNMLTTLVCGFCFANIAIGFWRMRWNEFSVLLFASIICAVVVIASRRALRKRALVK